MRDTKKGDKMSVGMIGQILEWVLLAIIFISALIGSNRGFLLSVFAMDDLPIVSTVNRLLGFVFGAVSGLLVVWTILAILGGVQEYSWAVQIVKAARANSVVMWLQSYSPIMIILKMMDFPVI